MNQDLCAVALLTEQLKTGTAGLVPSGTSMLPLISPGTAVVLEPVEGRPRVGDILCLVGPSGRLLVHRLLNVTKDGQLICRGDARWSCDPPADIEVVLGRVRETEKRCWKLWNALVVWGWAWPNHFLIRAAGQKAAETVTRSLFKALKPFPLLASEWRARRAGVRSVRADLEAKIVSRLCGLSAESVRTSLSEPDAWVCYLAGPDPDPDACILCLFRDGRCSIEAFGFREVKLGKLLMDFLQNRIHGPLYTLQGSVFFDSWEPEQMTRLLDFGFVSTPDGVMRSSFKSL